MTFFSQFKDSVYNPSFYHARRTASTGQAFGYFFILVLCISIISAVVMALAVAPKIDRYTSPEFISHIAQYYPSELQIRMKAGRLSTNVNEPYAIPFSAEVRAEMMKGGPGMQAENVVVIDTTHPLVIQNFAAYKTLVLLTEDYAVSQEKNGKVSVTPLKGFPDGVLDQTFIREFLNKVAPIILKLVPLLVPLGFVTAFVGYVVGYLFLLLIASLIVWIVYNIQKKDITYGTCYKLGLYAVTLSLIIDLIASVTQIGTVPWYANIILILIVLLANVRDVEPTHT